MTQPIYCADDWLMIQDLPPERVAALAAAADGAGWDDIVPGLDSLSLAWNPSERSLEQARAAAEALAEHVSDSPPSAAVAPATLHICYEQPWAHDADIVAELLGIAPDTLPQWHGALDWRVAMLGFQPGFVITRANDRNITSAADLRAAVAAAKQAGRPSILLFVRTPQGTSPVPLKFATGE